jgi:hypothetical protein
LLIENIYSNGGEKIDIKKMTSDIEELSKLLYYDNKLSLAKLKLSPTSVTQTNSFSKSKSKSKSKSNSKSKSKSKRKTKKSMEVDVTKIITQNTKI